MRNSSGHAKLAAEYHTPGARGLAFSICAVQMMHSGVFRGAQALTWSKVVGSGREKRSGAQCERKFETDEGRYASENFSSSFFLTCDIYYERNNQI